MQKQGGKEKPKKQKGGCDCGVEEEKVERKVETVSPVVTESEGSGGSLPLSDSTFLDMK